MIFDNTVCELGEGPLWHPERNQLFWFDILGKRLHTKGQHWQFEEHVSAAGWVTRDDLLIASGSALFRFNLETEEKEHVIDLEADNPVTRSNDGRADPYGGFWIGTMGKGAEDFAGTIYRFYKGELREIVGHVTISNGICFSPDNKFAYYTDTDTQLIMALPLDAKGWPEGTATVHLDLTGTPYRPDGAVIDQNGNLWSAQWGIGRVAGYKPDGTFIEAFDLPAVQSSCPAFGGPEGTTLYCTSAAVGQTGGDHGKTFAIETKYTGQKEHRVLL